MTGNHPCLFASHVLPNAHSCWLINPALALTARSVVKDRNVVNQVGGIPSVLIVSAAPATSEDFYILASKGTERTLPVAKEPSIVRSSSSKENITKGRRFVKSLF